MGIRIGIVGAGKMGISHFAIANALPDTAVVAVCDTSRYVISVLKKYAGVQTFTSYQEMIDEARPDAVIIATPTSTHFECAKYALERDVHLFVEKPLTLSPAESGALSKLAVHRRRINQVGFHNRFIGTFQEAQRLVRAGALGKVSNIHGSAFGQVVVKEQNRTWRASKSEGGGCLHDYASHVIDLMNFLVGPPTRVQGASLRKMTTTVTIHGTGGKLIVDRQELKVYLREPRGFEDYVEGWNTRYITGLQKPVGFYLRGEEYSAQVEAFTEAIRTGNMAHENSFASAYETDRVVDLILQANKANG